MEREIFERGHAVAVILYDPTQDRLVLIEQFRPGALVALEQPHLAGNFLPWLIEVVAGIIDDGETPENVARREALEEAGCCVTALHLIQRILASPGGSTKSITVYLGLTDAPAGGSVHGLDDGHEDIRVSVETPDTVFGWIDEQRIVNGPALLGLLWFRLNYQRLRDGWRPGPPLP